jgi:Oxoglutarate and iron-dependent oxygenase degradation C-term
MRDGDDARPFSPILSLPPTSELGPDSSVDSEELELSDSETAFLGEFIDPTYLDKKAIAEINSRFCDDSSVQLKNFLNNEISKKIFETTKKADTEDLLGLIFSAHYCD